MPPDTQQSSTPHCAVCPHRDHTIYLGGGVSTPAAVMGLRKDVRTIPKRKILYREGDEWDEFYNLYSGWAFSYRITNDGRRQIFDILFPGDAINMSAFRLDRAPFTVQALTDLIVCVFDRQALDVFMHDEIQRMHRVEHYWLNALWSVKSKLMDLGRRSSTQRIARFILGLEDRLRERGRASGGPFEFPLGHTHIADAIGLTPVHVNRIISSFRKQGLIELHSHSLHIKRRSELSALAK
jgi:CRP/FNR family transcriptional regulator